MKKKLITAIGAIVLCAAMTMPVMAQEVIPVGEGTDVYAGVVVDHEDRDKGRDPKIRVTVPTLFAFVANGTAKTSGDEPDQTMTGNVILPNVKANANGTISTIGDGVMEFKNYSTILTSGAQNREGLAVAIKGSLENKSNNWTHVATTPAAVKNYQLTVGGQKFSTPQENGDISMASAVDLAAPNVAGNLDPITQLAVNGSRKELDFGVALGGKRKDYKIPEESAKVGSIIWTVTYENPDASPVP